MGLKLLFVAALAALGAYWYWSPYVAVYQMRSAAEKLDADAFNQGVDYPKLRESLKGQFAATMAERMASTSNKSAGGAESLGAALGSILGMALVDRFVDALVRPEVVMSAMQQGRLEAEANAPSAPVSREREEVDWHLDRPTLDKVIAYTTSKAERDVPPRVGFVLERSGFADWKLTEIRLPAGALGRTR
jgi:hypothetical protein